MSRRRAESIKVSRYRCFGPDDPQGFDEIMPVNVIVGSNNTGKSSLLDVIKATVDGSALPGGVIHHYKHLEQRDVANAFDDVNAPSPRRGMTLPRWANQFLNQPIAWIRSGAASDHSAKYEIVTAPTADPKDPWLNLAKRGCAPLQGLRFYRLAAARDVGPADPSDVANAGSWEDDGSSVTRIIRAFLNSSKYPEPAVNVEMLGRLKEIFAPAKFQAIKTKTGDTLDWNVCLEEEGKVGPIPLSASGAGLKTVLSVLTMIELCPRVLEGKEPNDLHQYVFALEELENNLHPTLQRRLLQYVRDVAVRRGAIVFLTTHSSVAIDFFQGDKEAQILHVTHDGTHANVTRVDDERGHGRILDDLGAKASELLQSNCVVWVEGPSDRIYFNRWVEVWTAGAIREGAHYQCMFYGGALLSHVTAASHSGQDFVKLLRINRHAIVLFDHDGDSEDDELNKAKTRVLGELQEHGGLGWVTKGREVENYIPPDVLVAQAGLSAEDVADPYFDVPKALKYAQSKQGVMYRATGKVGLAITLRDSLKKEALGAHLDLAEKLDSVVQKIREWNPGPS